MSGHSKWATIKHKKGAADKARGKLFAKIARQLEVAAHERRRRSRHQPDAAHGRARRPRPAQMTNDAIDRAIKRGTGEDDGGTYEAITYEGYAPGWRGAADRRAHRQPQPHRSEVRNIFTKLGGSMAEPGAVGWQFSRRGVIIMVDGRSTRTKVMMAALEAGADDVIADGDGLRVMTRPVASSTT